MVAPREPVRDSIKQRNVPPFQIHKVSTIQYSNSVKFEFRRYIDIALAVLGFAYLALWYFKIEATDPNLGAFAEVAMISLNIIFALDYVGRFTLSKQKVTFVRGNLIELAAIVFPFFRAFRAFRVVLAVLQLMRIRGSRRVSTNVFLMVSLPLLLLGSALAILDAESTTLGSKITNLADAIWWAFSTLTTVGYGDIYPVSAEGRVIAAVLVVFGLGSLSVITANIATWFIEGDQEPSSEQQEH